MRLIQILAATAMIMSSAPAGMAAVTPDHAIPLQFVRGSGGHGGGFAGHIGGFRGGYAVRRGLGFRPRGYRHDFRGYPYAYSCAYPYADNYAYCFPPSG